jgi:cytochrome oxidase Cu insertion factor (SCO1/SenC/PrrC family)
VTQAPHAAAAPAVQRWWAAKVFLAAAVAGVAGGFALHLLRAGGTSAPAVADLPELHGQAVWSAGTRPAPGFALRDQNGAYVSLRALRGRPVLLAFLDSQCHTQCPVAGRQLGSILRRLPVSARPTLVVVSVDPAGDTQPAIRKAMRKWRLGGSWRWHWLNARRSELAAVWRSYGITVEPVSNDIVHSLALMLIDGRGYERTAYLFPFLPGFVEGDLRLLAHEAAA